MQRYFVESEDLAKDLNNQVAIVGDDAKHIARVMRNKIGDRVICSDCSGNSYICAIESIDTKRVILKIVSDALESNEPRLRITLYQGLLKADKMELVLQKGTEIGISSFVPVVMQFSVSKWEQDRQDKKLERWRKIVKEAAEQSHRSIIPDVLPAISFKELIRDIQEKHALALLAYEKSELSQGILRIVKHHSSIRDLAIIIGPEGGISPQECEMAMENGVHLVNLGSRILRAETAGLVAATGVLFISGELGEI